MVDIYIREMDEVDAPFIIKTCHRHYFKNSPQTRRVPGRTYDFYYGPLWNHIVDTHNVAVACDRSSPWQIFGFIIFDYDPAGNMFLYYVYVKDIYRGYGIGTRLTEFAESLAPDPDNTNKYLVHKTDKATGPAMHERGYRFNPFYIFNDLKEMFSNEPIETH